MLLQFRLSLLMKKMSTKVALASKCWMRLSEARMAMKKKQKSSMLKSVDTAAACMKEETSRSWPHSKKEWPYSPTFYDETPSMPCSKRTLVVTREQISVLLLS